nr:PREDICTED: flocculation protein FLO10-like [Bemisia tabaci]
MEEISSASDVDLEDGEIIDDSDSDLSIFNIKELNPLTEKPSSVNSVTGSDILLFPVHSPSPKKKLNKSKENKKVDFDGTKLVIQIPGLADSAKSRGDRPRHKSHHHRRRKKADKIYEDWNRSIDLLTSPKKRKKPVRSSNKYSSCESLSNEWRSSKKTCVEPKQYHVPVEGNPLLAKLLYAGDINPASVILKEINGKNEKPQVINLISDVSSTDLSVDHDVKSPMFSTAHSDVTDGGSDDFVTNQNAKTPSVHHTKLSASSSDIVAASDPLTTYNRNCQNITEPPSSGTLSETAKIFCNSEPLKHTPIIHIDGTSESSVQACEVKDFDTTIAPKNLSQSYLSYNNKSDQNDVYSPETFTPFDYNTLQDSETLELRAALANKSDLVSENYDCIPMSCSEDEDLSSVDSKSDKSEDLKPQQQNNDTDSEEEEELRLRISALKTWLQRKYGKTKPGENQSAFQSPMEGEIEQPQSSLTKIASSSSEKEVSQKNNSPDMLSSHSGPIQSFVDTPLSPSVDSDQSCSSNAAISRSQRTSSVIDRISSPLPVEEIINEQREDKEMDGPQDEADLKKETSVATIDNSLLDEEASENYELALRSLLVSKLLKQKLENSNDLLTESNLINKASSSLISKSPGKISSNSKTSQSSKLIVNSKYRTVNSTKTVAQNLKNSANKSGLIHCDSFQSKYVFNNFYEPPSQVEDSKHLSSISNFKIPVVEKFVIHLSEDSDYDSDESECKTAPHEKGAGSSESSSGNAVKIPMVLPNSKSSSKITESTQQRMVGESCSTTSIHNTGRDKSPVSQTALSDRQNRVTKSSRLQTEKSRRDTLEFQTRKTNSAAITSKLVKTSGADKLAVLSSPRKITSSSSLVSMDGSETESTSVLKEAKNVSNSPSSHEKLGKANSMLISNVLVPVEKKLLKSRLNLLTNLDSMQGCVSSCEENASKCSKSFAKIVQLQKALKMATSEYKTQFKSLKDSLQCYKVQSQKVSSCLGEYAQTQKDCAKAGKQILGPNYKTPNEGMSAMAMKFKLMKEKKLELLNNASIAAEIKKANFSSDASSTTVSAVLKSISEGSAQDKSLDPTAIPTIMVTNADSYGHRKSTSNVSQPGDTSVNVACHKAVEAKTVINASCDSSSVQVSAADSATLIGSSQKIVLGNPEPSSENVSGDTCENKSTALRSNERVGTSSSPQISSPPPLPEALLAMLEVMECEESKKEGVSKCQQKFTKYTPVLSSLSRSSGRDEKYSVDSIICPFNLQGTCRDETCEYKHLPN